MPPLLSWTNPIRPDSIAPSAVVSVPRTVAGVPSGSARTSAIGRIGLGVGSGVGVGGTGVGVGVGGHADDAHAVGDIAGHLAGALSNRAGGSQYDHVFHQTPITTLR